MPDLAVRRGLFAYCGDDAFKIDGGKFIGKKYFGESFLLVALYDQQVKFPGQSAGEDHGCQLFGILEPHQQFVIGDGRDPGPGQPEAVGVGPALVGLDGAVGVLEHPYPVALAAEDADDLLDQGGLAGVGMSDEGDYWIHFTKTQVNNC